MNKQISTLVGLLVLMFFMAIILGVAYNFRKTEKSYSERDYFNQSYCREIIRDLKIYVGNKNYCDDVSDCQIVWMPECNFGIGGADIDMSYVGEKLFEFRLPSGRCFTEETLECKNPTEGKIMRCSDDNRCILESYEENNDKLIMDSCEEYTWFECPPDCYRYIGPSSCGINEAGFEHCTEDIIEGCFSSKYDPFEN